MIDQLVSAKQPLVFCHVSAISSTDVASVIVCVGVAVGGSVVGVAVVVMGVGVATGAPHPTYRSIINIAIIPC